MPDSWGTYLYDGRSLTYIHIAASVWCMDAQILHASSISMGVKVNEKSGEKGGVHNL
jgi:hypothetical protein